MTVAKLTTTRAQEVCRVKAVLPGTTLRAQFALRSDGAVLRKDIADYRTTWKNIGKLTRGPLTVEYLATVLAKKGWEVL